MATVDLLDICERVVKRARRLGATQAEAYGERTREAAVRVREGEVEDLTQAEGKGLGLRVIVEGRLGFAYTSDFSDAALEEFVRRAVALAKVAAKDASNKLPDERALKSRNPELHGLFDPEIEGLTTDWKIEAARTMERAGKAEDKRVSNFESVGAGDFVADVAIHSSEGLHERYRGTYVYLFAAPVAKGDDGQLQTAYWVDYKRRLRDLETPEEIGRIAARRAARMLGAKKVKTQRVPVIFEPTIAASFVAGIASAVNGDLVRKGSSFLGDKLGKRIAPESITVVDDGLLPGGISTAPFDGEGIATRRTPVIERGVLQNFLYDSATARKAKAKPTGNARRGYSSLPGIGVTNFHLHAGDTPAQSIVKSVKNGLYVTAMLGRGANTVTGDYSRGANGIWIRNGEFAEPVQEVTVAGHMLDMLQTIDAVGDDIDFRGSVGAPTIRFAELTVSGS
ncbi:TldD/PmbA family protein [Vulgatibacter sp.]|uniref:TldD/PmbA family protein n=1 Tax=Vulgatibacter sp. TaxID=1971226 RepID=UPI0035639D8A